MFEKLGMLMDEWAANRLEKRRGAIALVDFGPTRAERIYEQREQQIQALMHLRDEPVYELAPETNFEVLYRTYKQVSFIRACVDVTAKAATSRGFTIGSIEEGVTPDPEEKRRVLELVRYPNENDTFRQLRFETFRDLKIFANAYWELCYDDEGILREINMLDAMSMRILATRNGTVVGYVSRPSAGEEIYWLPSEVCHFKINTMLITSGTRIGRSLYGLPEIDSLATAAAMDLWAQTYNAGFFKNGAKVRGIYTFANATRDQIERNRAYLAKVSKPQFSNQDIVLEGKDVKWTPIGTSPRDMEFKELRRFIRDEYLSVYQVPPSLIAIIETGNIGAGTGEYQQENFKEETVIPLQEEVDDTINQKVFRARMGVRTIGIKSRVPEIVGEKTQADIDNIYITAGVRGADQVSRERFPQDHEGIAKALKPEDIATRAGRTRQLVEITQDLQRKLREELKRQVRLLSEAFKEETRTRIKRKLEDSAKDRPFEMRYTEKRFGWFVFQKYIWPSFIKQDAELEAAFAAQDPETIASILFDHYVEIGELSAKTQAKQMRTKAPEELSAATIDAFSANANELAGHVSQTISDAARAEVVAGVEAGESTRDIANRIANLDRTLIEVRPPGAAEGAFARTRSFSEVSETIARTESRRIYTEVAKEEFRQAGISTVKWLAAGDRCPICEPFANKTYDVGAVPLGGPPAHHNCRCTLQPVVE